MRPNGKKKLCFIFEIDFKKAYDSVNKEFLYYMLYRMGFGDKWVSWIRICMDYGSVSILVNSNLTEEFKMHKGLQQGDPLALFPFYYCSSGSRRPTEEGSYS